uniref:NAD-dependent protein deacetylase sirtuin-7 n=1 Tax=Ciona intestinalis TaxID=7719 RepID=F7AUS4_CIOIN
MQSVFLPATECGSSDDVFIGADNEEKEVEDEVATPRTLRPRKLAPTVTKRDLTKQIREVVARRHHSLDEKLFLDEHCSLVKAVRARASSYSKLKQRSQEVFDDPVTLHAKCIDLAKALQTAKHAVVYTGAGISTAANIPDYRGTNGVWTRLKSGKDVNSCQNLVSAVPTFTHMCIEALVRHHIVQHVVSQNCDGLHVRSGVPSDKLSELHGNMFCEICPNCDATYYRLFDVTEHTALRRHSTGRTCDKCNEGLKDTIVHFGERSDARWPHNWESAESNAYDADLILCLGSSLKVLRSYKQLWLTERTKRNRPKLYIVNLQWTPKDSQATSKINGSVDEVMKIVMLYLSIVPAVYFHL